MSQVNHSDELDVRTQSSVTPEHEKFAMEALEPLAGLTGHLINVVAQWGRIEAGWHFDVEALTKKSLYHFVSLRVMGEPTILPIGADAETHIIDFASAFCLARALFENCVVFRYIFDRDDWINAFRGMQFGVWTATFLGGSTLAWAVSSQTARLLESCIPRRWRSTPGAFKSMKHFFGEHSFSPAWLP